MLAAGEASRFGSPKQRLFLPAVLAALDQSCVEDVVVVTGAHEVETHARVVHCAEWARGPGASLRCGLRDLDAQAALVVLSDGPQLDARAVDRVVEAWQADAGDALAATYDGASRSHPVLLARALWDSVPDEGARAIDVTLVPCEDLTPPGDIDVAHPNGDDGAPICPRCGVTMVPAALSADERHEGDWVCVECEELDEPE